MKWIWRCAYSDMNCVVAPQVPVSQPHPRSRAQRSHLWVPVTPAAIVHLFFFNGQRLKAKQRSADATEVEKEKDQKWQFGLLDKCLQLHSLNKWTDSVLMSVRNRTHECMYGWEDGKQPRKLQFCSLAGVCKAITSVRARVWSFYCTRSIHLY